AAEEHDVDTEAATDLARAVLPWMVSQCSPVVRGAILPAVMHQIVLTKQFQGLLHPLAGRVVGAEGGQTGLLQASRLLLPDSPRRYSPLQLGVPLDLRDSDGGIEPGRSVVVLAVVFERLSKRRSAIETRDPERAEGVNVIAARDSEEM